MGESPLGFRKSVDHLRNLKWEVSVIVDDTPNAACLPGGKIVVNSGLLKILEKDSQLATVLGHEVRVGFRARSINQPGKRIVHNWHSRWEDVVW